MGKRMRPPELDVVQPTHARARRTAPRMDADFMFRPPIRNGRGTGGEPRRVLQEMSATCVKELDQSAVKQGKTGPTDRLSPVLRPCRMGADDAGARSFSRGE